MQCILGSSSPRRKEILSFFSLPFIQVSPSFDEESLVFEGDPSGYASALAQGKALSLAPRFPEALILTADTVVEQGGRLFGKPVDREEAHHSLSTLAGKWHTVYTAVAVQQGDRLVHGVEASRVLFNTLTKKQVDHYLDHLQWNDKAGGYAIQGRGGLIVRQIEGCYYNIMGLPLNTVHDLLKKFGLDLWDYL